jgi:glucose-6-phosphate dehydrogenase assembly protein OpcA
VSEAWLESATAVGFAEVEGALTRERSSGTGTGSPPRALTATVVAVGPRERLTDVVKPLQELGKSGAIRGILIPEGSDSPGAQIASNVVVLSGLDDNFIDNAVASLRLSSLPTVIWWRGGPTSVLDNLIKLADRVVLDADPPEEGWQCAVERFDRAAFSDVRWTRLTRWRALMAQFFDLPEVREGADSFNRLHIEAADRPSALLFAAWMRTALQWGDRVTIDVEECSGPSPINCIALTGGSRDLHLRLGKSKNCVESQFQSGTQHGISGVVALGDASLTAILSDELRIRSRDHAFERAVQSAVAS